jgi:hypothetical protein
MQAMIAAEKARADEERKLMFSQALQSRGVSSISMAAEPRSEPNLQKSRSYRSDNCKFLWLSIFIYNNILPLKKAKYIESLRMLCKSSGSFCFYFGEGLHYRPGSAARPPKNHGPGPRGLRAHAVSTHPQYFSHVVKKGQALNTG